MSNIIKSQNDILALVDIINSTNIDKISFADIEEILQILMPKDNGNLLINYDIRKSGLNAGIFRLKS